MATSDTARAQRALARQEPVFAHLLKQYGYQDPFTWPDGGRSGPSRFAAMLLHILSQQISTMVAFAMYDRIRAALGGVPTPANIQALGPEKLRAAGLSRAKVTYTLDLADRQGSGLIDLENMTALDDADAIVALTAIRGVGLWSAQMFLIYQLHRSDVLPAGDLNIRHAVRAHWHLAEVPSIPDVTERSSAWAPYRTYAASLLWRSLQPASQLSDKQANELSQAAAKSAHGLAVTKHARRGQQHDSNVQPE